MMRSLYSGVTGLRNHQTRMDVIGNNIANVNTVGYKSSRVVFQDIYSQTLAPAAGPDALNGTGGTNPMQVGLGMSLSTIDVLHTKSAAQYTGNSLDLSIEGDGYFTVSNGSELYVTRAGNFYTDVDNNLVTSGGYMLQGFRTLEDGQYDDGTGAASATPVVRENIRIPSTAAGDASDYYNISINETGQVVGLEEGTNDKHVLAQLAMSTFDNQNALEKVGSNLYVETVNSGNADYSAPGQGAAGTINPGTLEMSNVDLANEFTDMIVTQRGFQANSRIITTTDSMLEELVNIKR